LSCDRPGLSGVAGLSGAPLDRPRAV